MLKSKCQNNLRRVNISREMPIATEFQLHIFATLAQEERRLISERTMAALAEAKKRGPKLGCKWSQIGSGQ
jgi:DNA invertase Pin-like site-specific DNA recombinase